MPAEAADKIELLVGGRIHSGWTEATVNIGIDSLAASFDLSITEQYPDGEGTIQTMLVEAGAEAVIRVGGEALITGFIDVVEPQMDKEGHSIGIAGRSKAADLIDCAAMNKPGSWSNRKLEDIASDLAKPFGLSVTAETDTGAAFKKFAIQPGETVFETIERMTKMRGLLPVSSADGNIVLMRPKIGGSAVRIEQGRDIEAFQARHDVSDRFSDYLLKGQSAGDDEHNGRAVAHAKGEAKDPGVKRYRPLLIVAEDQGSNASLKERAEWEAKVRAAKAQGIDVTLSGWRRPDGGLWMPGQTIDLVAPAAFITSQLIIANVNYQIADGGSTAVLSLAYPEAYAQPPGAEADAAKLKKNAS